MIIFKNSRYVGDDEVAYINLIKIITIRLIAMSYELVLVQYKYKLGSIMMTGRVNLLVDVSYSVHSLPTRYVTNSLEAFVGFRYYVYTYSHLDTDSVMAFV